MELAEKLKGIERVAIDTSPIIYFVEKHPIFEKELHDFFALISNGSLEAYTSIMALELRMRFNWQRVF